MPHQRGFVFSLPWLERQHTAQKTKQRVCYLPARKLLKCSEILVRLASSGAERIAPRLTHSSRISRIRLQGIPPSSCTLFLHSPRSNNGIGQTPSP